jgi:hypothetical protein
VKLLLAESRAIDRSERGKTRRKTGANAARKTKRLRSIGSQIEAPKIVNGKVNALNVDHQMTGGMPAACCQIGKVVCHRTDKR